jgi:S-DNA-T family DNA segregation ATPase FtsK/SpoIIIE
MDMLSAMRSAPKAVGAGALTGTVVLTAAGIAIAFANENAADVLLPFEFAIGLVNWAYIVATVVWGTAKLIGPALGLIALWNLGRQRQAAPHWALPEKLRVDGGPITPSIVVKAFRDLRIGELKKAILAMEDAGASMLSPIVIAGCGVEVDVTLPSSVSTDEIEAKRRKLAENLNRHEHEVFILKSPQPRTVKLWIADSGALDEPIGPSPLVRPRHHRRLQDGARPVGPRPARRRRPRQPLPEARPGHWPVQPGQDGIPACARPVACLRPERRVPYR